MGVIKRRMPARHVRCHLAAAVVLALLVGCGSSGPPSATSLAQKIPGCANISTNTPAVDEVQEVTCTLNDGSIITIGTFSSSGNETQWISDGGYPSDPDPAYVGCCVEGSGWAAQVGFNNSNVSVVT
jgi:hypothetical protein